VFFLNIVSYNVFFKFPLCRCYAAYNNDLFDVFLLMLQLFLVPFIHQVFSNGILIVQRFKNSCAPLRESVVVHVDVVRVYLFTSATNM
jgi:hypothetical protein